MLSALAEGLDPSAAERVFGFRHATITSWLSRAGEHAHTLHEHFFCQLHLPHLQLDELRTRLRSCSQVLWLWLVIDPCTRDSARALVFVLARKTLRIPSSTPCDTSWPPFCLPLFTSDGLNHYFYALTAHFGQWRAVGCRGRKVLRWQVAAGLIYGQGIRLFWTLEHGLH